MFMNQALPRSNFSRLREHYAQEPNTPEANANLLDKAREGLHNIQQEMTTLTMKKIEYESKIKELEKLQEILPKQETLTKEEILLKREVLPEEEILPQQEAELAQRLPPVYRCSLETFYMIFTYTGAQSSDCADDPEKKDAFRIATTLSHVCKSWRGITMRMKPLWKYGYISITDQISDAKLFLERTQERIQSSPIWIDVVNIGEKPEEDTEKFVQALGLERFEEIGQLYLSLNSSRDVTHISEPTLGTSLKSSTFVWVISEVRAAGLASPAWDYSWLLRLPKINSLRLEKLNKVKLGGSDSFKALTTLTLLNVHIPKLALHLSRLPNLKELTIVGEFKMDPVKRDIVMANLTYLQVEDVDNFPWDRLSAPRLEHVVTNDEDKAAIPFFCRHPSIRCLAFDTLLTKESFKKLACHLTNVNSIDIGGEIGGLFKQISPKVPFPPFPQLDTLCIEVGEAFNLSLQDVEEFIRLRCLPSSASKNGDITRIYEWTIQGEPRFIAGAPWLTSPLVLSSQSEIDNPYNEPWRTLSLIWPDS